MKLLALLGFVALGLANDVLLFDRDHSRAPPDWVSVGKASSDDQLEVVLHLYQRNRDKLDRVFAEVTNPKSSKYQNFLTKAEVDALVAPLPSDVALVYQWLATVGITKDQVVDYADALGFKAPVKILAPLFNTEFHTFFNGKTNQRLTAHVGKSYIPAAVRNVVEMVYGLSAFPVGVKGRLGHRGSAAPAYKVVAQSWQALYGVPKQWKPQSELTTQGVIQFDGETYSPEGMEGYSKNIAPITGPTKNTTVGPETDAPAIEAQLDVEAQAACGNGVVQWFWLETPSKWMLSFTTEFLAYPDPLPYSISISYAWSELDQCGQATSPYDCNTFGVNTQGLIERTNTNFQKAGLRGVSVMVASGDSGVHGRTDEGCQAKTFRPDFPASSPFVTSVGGTYIEKPTYLPSGGDTPAICQGGCVSGGEEVAVAVSPCYYTSGGGFSNYVAMPDWQKDVVEAYFTSGVVLPPTSMYNATNRGFPDVSAQGYNIEIYLSPTTPEPVSGTSAASPAFSGIISMLNDASIVKTGKPLGFLNPLLYQIAKDTPEAFNDVTKGDNRCTEAGCSPLCKGFNAFKGWDPVTGLGTPNYGKMKAALEQILDNKVKN